MQLAHVEIMDILDSGSALGPEPVVVIDPAGWVVLGIIFLLALIICYQYDKLKEKDEIIKEQNTILDYYYNEDLIK